MLAPPLCCKLWQGNTVLPTIHFPYDTHNTSVTTSTARDLVFLIDELINILITNLDFYGQPDKPHSGTKDSSDNLETE